MRERLYGKRHPWRHLVGASTLSSDVCIAHGRTCSRWFPAQWSQVQAGRPWGSSPPIMVSPATGLNDSAKCGWPVRRKSSQQKGPTPEGTSPFFVAEPAAGYLTVLPLTDLSMAAPAVATRRTRPTSTACEADGCPSSASRTAMMVLPAAAWASASPCRTSGSCSCRSSTVRSSRLPALCPLTACSFYSYACSHSRS